MKNNAIYRLLSMLVISALLLSMLSVTAFAGSFTTEQVTDLVVNAEFDTVTINASAASNSAETALADGTSYKTKWVYDSLNSWMTVGEDSKYIQNTVNTNAYTWFYARPDSAIDLTNSQNNGIIDVSFDYMFSNDKTSSLVVGINGESGKTYVTSPDTDPYIWLKNYNNSDNGLMLITGANSGKSNVRIGCSDYSGYQISKNTWYNFRLLITLSDTAKDNEQTLTLEIRDAEGTKLQTMKSKLDANVTTSDTTTTRTDSTFDKYTQFNGVHFVPGYLSDAQWSYCLDNIKVNVTHNENKFVSDLKNTLVDENFSNVTSGTSSGSWNKIPGTDLTWKSVWGTTSVANNSGAAAFTNSGSIVRMKADLNNTPVQLGDEIRISYTQEFTPSSKVGLNITNVDTDGYTSYNYSKLAPINGTAPDANAIISNTNKKLLIGGNAIDKWYVVDNVYDYTWTIKTQDPLYNNRQTITVDIDGTFNDWQSNPITTGHTQTFYLEEVAENDGIIKQLNNLMFESDNALDAVTLDNLKVEVIKPGFEVYNVANTGNSYTFSGNDAIRLNYNASTTAASKVIIARYNNDNALISATTSAPANGYITITPADGDKMIKAYIWDWSNAKPVLEAFELIRAAE